jgi:hypothetical protein
MEKAILEKIDCVKDLKIGEMVPIQIGDVLIAVNDGKREMHLPANMNGERVITWGKKAGGVFYRDLFRWMRGKDHGKYIHATGEDISLILRIVSEEEMEDFQYSRLVIGKLKDENVMLLKDLNRNDKKQEDSGYIDECEPIEDSEKEDSMLMKKTDDTLNPDDEANSGRSVSLFD